MTKKERVSIIRIVQDIIRADGIIDMREMLSLNALRTKYGIGTDDEAAACDCSLSEALKTASLFTDDQKKELYSELYEVVMSDEINARKEAVLMLALHYALNPAADDSFFFFSADAEMLDFDNRQILYVEGETDAEVNRQICQFYREISSEIRIVGFDFVYIPKISEHYCSLPEARMSQILSFLYPRASEERISLVIKQIQTLTTENFCKDVLSKRLGIPELESIEPSLMINIGKSVVDGKASSNFLVIGVGKNALGSTRKVVDTFSEIYRNQQLNYVKEEKDRFVFAGYHKALLDLMMLRTGIRSTVLVDYLRERICFPEADTKIEGIHRREKALYALFLLETPSGGINFSRPSSAKQITRYDKRIKVLMDKYRLVYRMFGGEANEAPDISNPNLRMPMISLLKRRIMSKNDVLYHVEDYTIRRNNMATTP